MAFCAQTTCTTGFVALLFMVGVLGHTRGNDILEDETTLFPMKYTSFIGNNGNIRLQKCENNEKYNP